MLQSCIVHAVRPGRKLLHEDLFDTDGERKIPKTSWPELRMVSTVEAKRIIEQEAPHFKVYVHRVDDEFVTADYREDRVRIFEDGAGIVQVVPQVG